MFLEHQIRTSGIQIFTVSESWLVEAVPDKVIKIEGYNTVRADRKWKDGDKEDLHIPKRRGSSMLCKGRGHLFKHKVPAPLEMMLIKLSLENVRLIVIVTVYRPPQGSYVRCCEMTNEAFDKTNLKG